MSSVKSWVVGMAAGAVACGSVGAMAQSLPTLVVGKHSQVVQTPTAAPSGAVYQATSPQTGMLTAYTEGFLFCSAYVEGGQGGGLPITLDLQHEDQSPQFNPAHGWALPSVLVAGFTYNAGRFTINPGLSPSNLVCHSVGAQGDVRSGTDEGVFDNGYDSATEVNYNHLVNWTPSEGFDWNAPDWSQVPADACGFDAYDQGKAPEDVGCAAVTGVQTGEVRAPKMWTVTDGTTFTYIFRVHARLGAPAPGVQATPEVPNLNSVDEPAGSIVAMRTVVKDAYDKSSLSATGTYCLFGSLPQTVDTNVCASTGSGIGTITDGFLSLSVQVGQPPLDQEAKTFYVAVNRQLAAGHQALDTPIAAVSILVDPAITAEGADNFTGDDVVFGFMPSSSGFPWMSGQ